MVTACAQDVNGGHRHPVTCALIAVRRDCRTGAKVKRRLCVHSCMTPALPPVPKPKQPINHGVTHSGWMLQRDLPADRGRITCVAVAPAGMRCQGAALLGHASCRSAGAVDGAPMVSTCCCCWMLDGCQRLRLPGTLRQLHTKPPIWCVDQLGKS